MLSFPYEVNAPEKPVGTFVVTIKMPIPEKALPSDVINYIRSPGVKNDLNDTWVKKNAPNHGMEVRGGPRPVLENAADRTSRIVAYEQDFKLCPRV